MDASIRKSLTWKDRALLLPLSIGMIAMAAFVMVGMQLFQVNVTSQEIAGQLFGVTMLFGCVVAIAVGTMMFVPEREEESDQLLATFPVDGSAVANTKIKQAVMYFLGAWGVIGLLAIVVFLARYGNLIYGISSEQHSMSLEDILFRFLIAILIPIECFLWSMLISIRSKRALVSVLLAAACTIVGVFFATYWFDLLGLRIVDQSMSWWIFPSHAFLVVGLACGVAWASPHWLRGDLANDGSSTATAKNNWLTPFTRKPKSERPAAPFRSLVWQNWRTRRLPLAACLGLIGFGVVACLVYYWSLTPLTFQLENVAKIMQATCSIITILATIVGLSTFANDQFDYRFRFFQQQADYPRHLWASRVILIALVGAIGFLAFLFCCWFAFGAMMAFSQNQQLVQRGGYDGYQADFFRLSFWHPIMIFVGVAGVGQLCSMLVRSGILLILVGAPITLMSGFVFVYLALINEPLRYFGWPLALTPYVITFWYTSDWIRERHWWRALVVSVLAIAVVSTATFAGLGYHRLTEFKSLPEFEELRSLHRDHEGTLKSNPEKYAGAIQLDRGYKKLVGVDDVAEPLGIEKEAYAKQPIQKWPAVLQDRYIEANEPGVREILAAISKPSSRFFLHPSSPLIAKGQALQVSNALNRRFEYLVERGELEEALPIAIAMLDANRALLRSDASSVQDFWPRAMLTWLDSPGKSKNLIMKGLADFDAAADRWFDPEINPTNEKIYFQALTNFELWMKQDSSASLSVAANTILLPTWEAERSIRVLERAIASDENRWRNFSTIDKKIGQVVGYASFVKHYSYPQNLKNSTVNFAPQNRLVLPDYAVLNLRFRYLRIRFALAAYYADHQEYPESLADLEPDYLPIVPAGQDGRDFAYSAAGKDLPVIAVGIGSDPYQLGRSYWADNSIWTVSEYVPADEPFLLPYTGVVELKRDFVLQSNEKNAELNLNGELPPVTARDRQRGYWIPVNGQNSIGAFCNGAFLISMESSVLPRHEK